MLFLCEARCCCVQVLFPCFHPSPFPLQTQTSWSPVVCCMLYAVSVRVSVPPSSMLCKASSHNSGSCCLHPSPHYHMSLSYTTSDPAGTHHGCSSPLFIMAAHHHCSSWLLITIVHHGCSSPLFIMAAHHHCCCCSGMRAAHVWCIHSAAASF